MPKKIKALAHETYTVAESVDLPPWKPFILEQVSVNQNVENYYIISMRLPDATGAPAMVALSDWTINQLAAEAELDRLTVAAGEFLRGVVKRPMHKCFVKEPIHVQA